MTLSVRNLRAGYGDRAVIGSVSFELEAGEMNRRVAALTRS